MSEQIVVHRAFDGVHELSDACWCAPTVVDSDDLRDGQTIARELEHEDG